MGLPAIDSRRLAAIMFVDMVGYSSLMQQSEARAIAAVRTLWDLVRPILKQHGGLEIDLAGDGMLTEFSGALSAVRCALAIHDSLAAHNAPLPEAARIRTRAGIHLGDIEHRDGRIYGDGINIAARLLALSPPGAVTISSPVRDQLLNVLDQPLHRLGLRRLKNIKLPMELWCLAGSDCKPADITAAQREDEGARCWTFGDIRFDGRSFELTRRGQSIALDKRALDLLTFLLHHAGEVVTKDEILDQVWTGRDAAGTRVEASIESLREALGDEAQTLIRDVHGFGYRFAAPVQVESIPDRDSLQHFDFKPGDKPPLRPLWSLVERLGIGGRGEAWLARHDKTKELRVFKFALDAGALTSLKREITLFRVLKDSLGTRREYVQILDWNLEEMPYFLECEHCAGGNLAHWAQTLGGLKTLAMPQRLDIAAQVAEALAAAHSVGVLHKDLKPSNVLVEAVGSDTPKIKLADFGSGGVVDSQRLEEMGITRMGFTKTILDLSDTTSGTPIYMAPEVISGQPFTVQSDIYALGVILYQLVYGNFSKLLSPGWERDIKDELIREDIALAAEGHVEERLADAAEFARRLRGLNERRREKDEKQQLKAKEQRARETQEKLRRLRWVTAALVVLSLAAIGGGVSAYRAQAQTKVALVNAKVVSDFMIEDVLGFVDRDKDSGYQRTLQDLLDHAARRVPERLAEQPLAAAQVHKALASAYGGLGWPQPGELAQIRAAAALYEKMYGRQAPETVDALFDVSVALRRAGNHEASISLQREVLERRTINLGASNPQVLLDRLQLAALLFDAGEWETAISMSRDVLKMYKSIKAERDNLLLAQYTLAEQLGIVADFEEAEALHQEIFTALNSAPSERYLIRPRMSLSYMSMLIERGHYQAAETLGTDLQRTLSAQLAGGVYLIRLSDIQASLLIEQGQIEQGLSLLKKTEDLRLMRYGSESFASCAAHDVLGYAYERSGRHYEAVDAWRKFIKFEGQLYQINSPQTVSMYARLADALRGAKKNAKAWEALNSITPLALQRLPPRHPHLAELRRVQGLLWIEEGKHSEARAALAESLDIYEFKLGNNHWRTRRGREELAQIR